MLIWFMTLLLGEGSGSPAPTPDVGTGFGRRRMASYIKRGGVGTLRGRST